MKDFSFLISKIYSMSPQPHIVFDLLYAYLIYLGRLISRWLPQDYVNQAVTHFLLFEVCGQRDFADKILLYTYQRNISSSLGTDTSLPVPNQENRGDGQNRTPNPACIFLSSTRDHESAYAERQILNDTLCDRKRTY